jgi:hypothetical protein
MKHMSLLAVMLGGVLWTVSLAAYTAAPLDLDGRELVERASRTAKMPPLCQVIAYEIAGPEDANTVYTIQLSDKMLESLFK